MTPWVSFDGKNCGGCKHLNERGYCEFTACIIPCTIRTTIPEVKPQTNGDRIRSMTDEELAAFLSNLSSNGCDSAECPARHGCEAFSVETCKEQMEKWLRQGAT